MLSSHRPQSLAWAPLLLLQCFAAGSPSPHAKCPAQRLPDDSVAMAQVKLQLWRRAEAGGGAGAEAKAGVEAEVASSADASSDAAAAINPHDLYWTPPKGDNPEMWKVPKDPESWAYRWGWVKPKIQPRMNSSEWYHNDYPFRTDNSLEELSYTNDQAAWHPGHPGDWSKKQKEEDEKVDKEWQPIIHKENVEARKFWKEFPYMSGDGIGADALDKFTTDRKLYPNENRPLNHVEAKNSAKKAGAAKNSTKKAEAKEASAKKATTKKAAKKAAPKKKASFEEERQEEEGASKETVSEQHELQFGKNAKAKLNEAEADLTHVAEAEGMSKQGILDNMNSVSSIDEEIAEALADARQQQGSASSTHPLESTDIVLAEEAVSKAVSEAEAVIEADAGALREEAPTVAAARREGGALDEVHTSESVDGDVAAVTRADSADVRI